MKIRTQLYLTTALFGIALLIISASMVTTTAELDRLDEQENLADRVGLAAADLNYLGNEYLLYGEPQQLDRWNWRYAALSDDLSSLSAGSAEQQALVATILGDQQRLKAVFDDIVERTEESSRPPLDPASLQASWSRLGVQTQGFVYDASRLSALLGHEADRLRFVNTLLIAALLGTFSVFLLTSYLAVNRRTLQSIAALQAGAAVIGSGGLDHAIPVTSDDEVGELTGAFNRMAADLRTVTASRADLEQEVAERRRAEEALRESEEWLRLAQESANVAVWDWDVRTGEQTYTPALLRLYGLEEDRVYRYDLWREYVHPEDLERFESERDVALARGTPFDLEFRVVHPSGEVRWLASIGRGQYNETGGLVRVLGANLDITERKEAEETLKRYAAELEASNEELQRYAYVASHDLQEPLRSIVSFSQLLERRYKGKLGQDADDYIGFIVEGGTRMQALILDLLQFSRVTTSGNPAVETDAGAVLAGVVRGLTGAITAAGATVTVGSMPQVMADPMQLEQVFANLIGNALKYRRADEPPAIRIEAARTGDWWEFAVADNGIGIAPEYFDRIFILFQRLHTKEAYPGTGIGLAVVKKIVERHGGRIRVESVPGEGTTFFFTLPAA